MKRLILILTFVLLSAGAVFSQHDMSKMDKQKSLYQRLEVKNRTQAAMMLNDAI